MFIRGFYYFQALLFFKDANFQSLRFVIQQGTLFVLAKDVPATEQLTEAIAAGDEAATLQLVEQVIAEGRGVARPAESKMAEGRWRLIWTAQARVLSGVEKKWKMHPVKDAASL